MNFDELVGKKFKFYGASENQFKLDKQVWKAEEDENDGYRSCLGSIALTTSDAIFFKRPIATVIVKEVKSYERYEFEGWELIDAKDGHTWLTFGTQDPSDYYPSFIFNYEPKKPADAESTTQTK